LQLDPGDCHPKSPADHQVISHEAPNRRSPLIDASRLERSVGYALLTAGNGESKPLIFVRARAGDHGLSGFNVISTRRVMITY
jgi:hypothetical protein